MSTRTLIGVEEFDRLVEPDDLRYELDEGELVVMTRPRPLHNRIAGDIYYALRGYLERNPIGQAWNSDNMYVLGPNTKRAPDASFLRRERVEALDLTKEIQGAPDLAVEVLSPEDSVPSMHRKMQQYLAAGASVVWLVYPASRKIEVWERPDAADRTLTGGAVLDGGTLLPGFALPLDEVFRP